MKVYYLKHNTKNITEKGVYFSMNIITPYELRKISVEQIIIYLRKSRAERNETVEEVLARHERILQDFAIETFGEKIPEKNIYREVVSGETLDERIEIKEVFNRLEKEEIKGLLVVEPQRISRGGMSDCGRVVDILKYTETLCITITKTYDLNNKFDRELFEAQLLQGNKYLEYHKEIMDRGKALSLREGKYVGSTPPFGYDRKQLDKGFMLVKHKEEAPIVEMIFNMFVDENLTTVEIAGYLNKHRLKPKKNELWDYQMVKHVLKNEVYYGSLAWGKRPVIKKLINGEINKIRITKDEYMLVRGMQEPIVTKEKWDAAQEKIKNNRPKNNSSHELQNPLAGLVFCEKCGYSLVRIKNRRRGKERKKVRKYELDKMALNAMLREAKEKKGVSYNEIAKFLGISRHKVIVWFDPRPDYVYYTETFSEKWYELKFLLEIDTTEFDKQILTYVDPRPLNDTLMCSNYNCDMVSCTLQKLEKALLDNLRKQLKEFNHYIDNYEEEIIKERLDNKKAIDKINRQLDGLKKELRNALRNYNKEENGITYNEYSELKKDINDEIEELQTRLEELENDDENDTLLRYKKLVPILADCLLEYDNMSIVGKNESLKSFIERITYSKTKRLNWRVKDEDDMKIHVELKI